MYYFDVFVACGNGDFDYLPESERAQAERDLVNGKFAVKDLNNSKRILEDTLQLAESEGFDTKLVYTLLQDVQTRLGNREQQKPLAGPIYIFVMPATPIVQHAEPGR